MIPGYCFDFPTISELEEKYKNYKPTIKNFGQKATLIRNLAWTGPITKSRNSSINYGVTLSLDKIKQSENRENEVKQKSGKETSKITRYWGIIDSLYASSTKSDNAVAKLYWYYIIDFTNNINE